MNDQVQTTSGAMFSGAPIWLTVPFVIIGLGILFALFILFRGNLLAMRRHRATEELIERGEAHFADDAEPAPLTEEPLPAPPASPEPPIADEPIAAAAPLDASPAALAAETPEPAAPAPSAPAPAGADDLTRMKGVGPKLVEKLASLGITSFAQLAALTPAEVEALDAQLGNFQGRIQRDRWLDQARFLAANDVAGYEAMFGKL